MENREIIIRAKTQRTQRKKLSTNYYSAPFASLREAII
jgi:hypothetical protein